MTYLFNCSDFKRHAFNIYFRIELDIANSIFYTVKQYPGSREESKVADFFVFSHIRMMGYFRLGYVRVNECPVGRKPIVQMRRNRPLRIHPLIKNPF